MICKQAVNSINFAAPRFIWWWKTVPTFKPVCKCRKCKTCLNPLKPLERFGVGRYVCPCGNVFFCRCQASDSRKCDYCGRIVYKPYIRPFFRVEDTRQIPEQQYYDESNNAPAAGHGYYHYPSCSFSPCAGPFSHPVMNSNANDLPHRRGRHFLRDYFPPEFYMGDTRYSAPSHPPHAANVASMHPYFTTEGILPGVTLGTSTIYPSSAVSLQNSSINIGSALCTANSHAVHAPPIIQSPAAIISHPIGSSEPLQGQPRLPQPLVPGLPPPVCSLDCSTTSGEISMAVASCNVHPDHLDYVPSETQVIPSPNLSLQPTNEHNCFPQPQTTSAATVPLVSEDGSVPGETIATPSSSSASFSPTSASENPLQDNQQPPLIGPSTSGQLSIFPTAVDSSDPESLKPIISDDTFYDQPQLNSSSANEHFSMSLDNALADLHLAETSRTPPQSETSGDAPVALISPLQPAAPNPPLATAEISANTGTGVLIKATHVSSEKLPSDLDYNPPETTAIPPPAPANSTALDLTASKHHESFQAESGADAMSKSAATNSDLSLSLTESSTSHSMLTALKTSEASSTAVHLPSSQTDATFQMGINTSKANTTLNPPLVLTGINTMSPLSSSFSQPSQQATTISTTPHATATKFEPKAEPSTIPPISFNILNISIHDNLAPGATAAEPTSNHPSHKAWQNDQPTAPYYHDHRVRGWRKNPRDLKYKQVSTRHMCSGSTIGTDIVPQLNDQYQNTKLKMHQVRHEVNSLGNQREYSPDYADDLDRSNLDYDMMEVSSEEDED